jgi:hypothetical protein
LGDRANRVVLVKIDGLAVTGEPSVGIAFEGRDVILELVAAPSAVFSQLAGFVIYPIIPEFWL